MIGLRTILLAISFAGYLATSCFALPYSDIYFFGDSLSDVGNLKQSSILFPGSAYFNGRFSNGPVYSELLTAQLGLGTLVHSRSSGNNFAHGNAQTSGNADIFVLDVQSQVTQFLDERTTDPDALYVIWGGANDFLGGQTNVNVPVNNLVNDINRLINDGAENFLVANLPLLGLTPEYNGNPTQAASFNAITQNFNTVLWSALDTIEANSPSIDLFRLDVAQLIDDAIADPNAFGFVNVTDSAAPGLTGASLFYNTSNIVPQPNTYLFWDNVHPTAAAHALLAQEAFDAVTFSADFDFDGKVDSLDRVEWEASYGLDALADANNDGLSNADDFLIWQRQNGSGISALTAVVQTVPEPNALILSVTLVAGCLHRPRRKRAGNSASNPVH